jgi:hypothetical protein
VDEGCVLKMFFDLTNVVKDALSRSSAFQHVVKRFAVLSTASLTTNEVPVCTYPNAESAKQKSLLIVSKKCSALLDQLVTFNALCIKTVDSSTNELNDESCTSTVDISNPLSVQLEHCTHYQLENINGIHSLKRMVDLSEVRSCWLRAVGEQDKVAAIVFCHLRVCAEALNQLVKMIILRLSDRHTTIDTNGELSSLIASPVNFGLRSAVMLGSHTRDRLSQTLCGVKNNTYNLLFVTDVAEEGLDIQQCSIILHFDDPARDISFIQRRGRARSSLSLSIHFVESAFEPTSLIRWTQSNTDNSKKRLLFQHPVRTKKVKELENYIDREQEMKEEIKKYLTSYLGLENNLRIKNRLNSQKQKQIVNFSDKDFNLVISGDNILSPSMAIIQTSVYKVPSTGALIDMGSAVSLLTQLFESTKEDEYSQALPIFLFENKDGRKFCRISFLEHQRGDLLFPQFVAVASRKVTAKGLACLSAIQYFHENNRLDDHLQIVRFVSREQLLLMENTDIRVDKEKTIAISVLNRPSFFSVPSCVTESLDPPVISTPGFSGISRSLSFDDNKPSPSIITVHIYRLTIDVDEDTLSKLGDKQRSRQERLQAKEMSDKQRRQIEAFENIGIASCSAFPFAHDGITVPIVLKNIDLTLTFSLIASCQMKKDSIELSLVRAFHDMICHIRTFLPQSSSNNKTESTADAANLASQHQGKHHDDDESCVKEQLITPMPIDTPFMSFLTNQETRDESILSKLTEIWNAGKLLTLEDYWLIPLDVNGLYSQRNLAKAVLEGW